MWKIVGRLQRENATTTAARTNEKTTRGGFIRTNQRQTGFVYALSMPSWCTPEEKKLLREKHTQHTS